MSERKTRIRRRGSARLAIVWLLAWASAAAFFLYEAAPKAGTPPAARFAPLLTCATPSGLARTKNIEDVRAGERVWAYDPGSGKWEPKEVLKPLVHQYEGDLVTVTVAGHTVQATGNHPFWVEDGRSLDTRPLASELPVSEQSRPMRGRWVDARHLEAGDVLVLRAGGLAPIEMVTVSRTTQPVFNLKVADLHTYAVGEVGIAVHNKCFPPGTPVLLADGSTKPIEQVELGDAVLARDPEAGGPARPAEVTGLIRDLADGLVHVTFETPEGTETTVTSTRFHPFWTRNRGWIIAKDLETTDILEDKGGKPVSISSVSAERRLGRSHNLTVAGVHTYFVAAGSTTVLVHNANPHQDALLQQAAGGGEVILYRAPPASTPQAQIQSELLSGFDPVNYPPTVGNPPHGPYFSVNDPTIAQGFEQLSGYSNGIQRVTIPSSDFADLVKRGIIQPDGYYAAGKAVHVPNSGLPEFNPSAMKGSPNTYTPHS